ncbi:hypothetical protein M427DRAFT_36315 [Gonapodya prolifera JEL478]|uniref:Uncharacterized protein n=1 Tax=Gonapodya prolifera (strain JEL478) TaxID=1344416 RepID=A0A139A2Z3_GONPJ|nr:hypothetical protein M427DRAFT_36315 [Gonapodya prolifera JEL478]|eukprot:KXS11131.1 hypothetical protein M427DRAFT_36315 [Gonapodya prolifera JEL478]
MEPSSPASSAAPPYSPISTLNPSLSPKQCSDLSRSTVVQGGTSIRHGTFASTADLLRMGTQAHSGSSSTPSVRVDPRHPQDWLLRVLKIIRRRGRWSLAFAWWTVVSGAVIEALVLCQVAMSVGSFTPHEMVITSSFAAACIYSAYLSFSAIANNNIFEVCGAIFFSVSLFGFTITMAVTDTDMSQIMNSLELLSLFPSPSTPPPSPSSAWYASYLPIALPDNIESWSAMINPLQTATSVMCALQFAGQLALLSGTWREVEWKAFRKVGADRAMQRRYGAYTFLLLQTEISFFFALAAASYSISYLVRPVAPPFLAGAERTNGVVGFVIVATAMMGVLAAHVFKIFPIPLFTNDVYFLFRDMGTFLCIFHVLLCFSCACTAVVCAQNFGFGLQRLLQDGRSNDERLGRTSSTKSGLGKDENDVLRGEKAGSDGWTLD